jgi:hypothetical protein
VAASRTGLTESPLGRIGLLFLDLVLLLYVTEEEESEEEERRRVGIMRPMMVTKWATLWHLWFSSGTVYVST